MPPSGWTIAEAAVLLDPPVHPRTLRRWVHAEAVPACGQRRASGRGRAAQADCYAVGALLRVHAAHTLGSYGGD